MSTEDFQTQVLKALSDAQTNLSDFQSKTFSRLNSLANAQEAMGTRITAIEVRLSGIEYRLERIEDRLRKIELFVPTENADFMRPKVA